MTIESDNKSQVYSLLFKWLRTESGMTVIRSNQKGPRPARPYASINFLNPSSPLGEPQERGTLSKTVLMEVMNKAVASINVFGDNACDTLSRIRDSLGRADVRELFEAADVAHLDDGPINDLTALEETDFLERAQFDLTVSFVASQEVDVGTIEHVDATGTMNGRPVKVSN